MLGDERTFGKGLIQSLFELSDGSGVAVTIARYLTPSGQDINGVGIVPNAPLPAAAVAAVGSEAGDLLPTLPAGFCSAAGADGGEVGRALLDAAAHPPAAKPSSVAEEQYMSPNK